MSSISGISSMQGMMGMMGMRQMSELTDDQKTKIEEILSEYDPNNITEDTAQEIFDKFREAGITPAKGMKEAIEAAGFDADELRSLGMSKQQGVGGPQGAGGTQPPPPPPQQSQELTDEQKSTIEEILSEYDPDNITEDDAKEIFQKFSDAGIQPAAGMKEAIEEAGFDAEQIREWAMPDIGNMGYSSSSQGINTSALQSLQTILNQYDFSNLSSDKQESLYTQLQSAGLLYSGTIIDIGI